MGILVSRGACGGRREGPTDRPARLIRPVAGLVLLLVVVWTAGSAWSGLEAATVVPPRSTVPHSWLAHRILLTVYGRGFGTAPMLGELGLDRNFGDVQRQVSPYRQAIQLSARRHVRVAIHLIYAMAKPCDSEDTCLLYLDDAGVDLVKTYIKPAARRGWLVILDDQLGRSNPVSEIQRMIAKGYLHYDNVEVAFDPEYRVMPGQSTPGMAVGSVSDRGLNAAERVMNSYAAQCHLAHRKLMLVHEWTRSMIEHRQRLKSDLRYVRPVVVMDGIGTPAAKARTYTDIERMTLRDGTVPGIKLFPPGPYTQAGHVDLPMLSFAQLFAHVPAQGTSGQPYYITPAPRVIVLT